MKWKKLGKIFDPTEYNLPNNCIEFAQSPQSLVFDDFVRIYFSTREKDETGKYLSHIAFVDMDKSFKKVIAVSTNTVIELGGLGCFDEHGIFPLNIMRDHGRVLGYISGWSRRVSVSVETSIGLAVSNDNGLTFKRIGDGPVLTSSPSEPFLVGDPFVLNINGLYHMWYIYGLRWINNPEKRVKERIYKIGHAVSNDGINWIKDGRQLVTDKLNADECQALPTVIEIDGKYHMYFCYRQAIGFRQDKNSAYRIGHAFSENMQNWIRDDTTTGIDTTDGDWDSDMMCYPHVFRCEDKIYMLYNGNEFGRLGFGLAVLER
ncbi:MAG: hypothetical protein IPO22_19115 [Anaerolineales bacterium]|nr:hypothetical protein [Anaerolineales bacterium]